MKKNWTNNTKLIFPNEIEYSEKKYGNFYEYRIVKLTKPVYENKPAGILEET